MEKDVFSYRQINPNERLLLFNGEETSITIMIDEEYGQGWIGWLGKRYGPCGEDSFPLYDATGRSLLWWEDKGATPFWMHFVGGAYWGMMKSMPSMDKKTFRKQMVKLNRIINVRTGDSLTGLFGD